MIKSGRACDGLRLQLQTLGAVETVHTVFSEEEARRADRQAVASVPLITIIKSDIHWSNTHKLKAPQPPSALLCLGMFLARQNSTEMVTISECLCGNLLTKNGHYSPPVRIDCSNASGSEDLMHQSVYIFACSNEAMR